MILVMLQFEEAVSQSLSRHFEARVRVNRLAL